MPDMVIRHIDRMMAERIQLVAKERKWSINDVMLHALRHGLGVQSSYAVPVETSCEPRALDSSGMQWESGEQAAFAAAMQALVSARAEPLVEAAREKERSEALSTVQRGAG